jgi:mono/diheme cytochrome c family protein
MARWPFIVGICGIAAIASGPGSTGAAAPRQAPQITAAIETGRETFLFNCAPCHGRGGRGDGPVTPALKSRPSDLTTIARRRKGAFPKDAIADLVTGRGRVTPAHGSHDMPVWGPAFREQNPFDSAVDVRLSRLMDYLESIQVK